LFDLFGYQGEREKQVCDYFDDEFSRGVSETLMYTSRQVRKFNCQCPMDWDGPTSAS